jgi:hypothetical protein
VWPNGGIQDIPKNVSGKRLRSWRNLNADRQQTQTELEFRVEAFVRRSRDLVNLQSKTKALTGRSRGFFLPLPT